MNDLLISVATYNRKKITEISLSNLNKYKNNSAINIYDDCSTEYNVDFLSKFGKVYRNNKNLGVHKTKEKQFEDFLKSEYKYLYITDSDAIHDPSFLEVLEFLPKEKPISLYSSLGYEIAEKWKKENYFFRRYSGGISHFYTRDMVATICEWLKSNNFKAWDYDVMDILGGQMLVTNICYVEHLGKGGLHSSSNWDHDYAINPTRYLKKLRTDSIMYIEGCGEFPEL